MGDDFGIGIAFETRPARSARRAAGLKFSMMPLWTSASTSVAWGWALAAVGAPWVAQRVWAMPVVPGAGSRASSRTSPISLPGARRRISCRHVTVQTPALS
jgi:hypothetical protein